MKTDNILKTQRKRVSSSSKLPPIVKLFPHKKVSKQNINKLQVSLQMMGHYSRPRAHTKISNPSLSSQKRDKISSFRLRTDAVGNEIVKNKSFAQNSASPNKSDLTLQNFNKHIKINKQYIQREIKKRNQSRKIYNRQNSLSTEKPNSPKKRLATNDDSIFNEIQQIIKSKLPNNNHDQQNKLNLSQVHQLIKMTKVNKNLRKLSPHKSINQLKKSFQTEINDSSRVVLKDENNYHQWKRVQLCMSHQSPRYKQSTFEIESQRLEQFALKNQVNLSKYFEYRKQLYLLKSKKLKTSIS